MVDWPQPAGRRRPDVSTVVPMRSVSPAQRAAQLQQQAREQGARSVADLVAAMDKVHAMAREVAELDALPPGLTEVAATYARTNAAHAERLRILADRLL